LRERPEGSTRRPQPRRALLAVLLLGLASWLAVCAALLLSAGREAQDGRDLLTQARDTLSRRDFLSGEAEPALRTAQSRFSDAEAKAGSWVVYPLRVVPVLGRQVRSLEALSRAGAELLEVGADGVEEISATLERGLPTGPGRTVVLRDLAALTERTAARISTVDLGPSDALVGELADARATLERELGDALDMLDRASNAAVGLADVLDGPRRYLLLAANNAEMQAGWGMPLSAGLLEVRAGQLELGEMGPTADLQLDETVPLPSNLEQTWGWLEPGREWRNLAVSPNLDVIGPVALSMWEVGGGEALDGVLVVDPFALQAFLRATGPVEVDGRSLGAEDVVDYLLHEQYEGLQPGSSQSERRERLSEVAEVAIAALEDELDLIELVEGLIEAANGRHILAWSPDTEEQRTWVSASIDGALTEDSLLVSLVNRGANKLDWFVDVAADLALQQTNQGRMGVLRIRVDNSSPTEPSYVAGPSPRTGAVEAGDYVGVVTVHLPRDSTLVALEGAPPSVRGKDGATEVVGAALLRLPAGASADLELRFLVRPDLQSLVIEPSARSSPVRWRAGDLEWDDGERHTVWLAVED
jgi:hypothetical protein